MINGVSQTSRKQTEQSPAVFFLPSASDGKFVLRSLLFAKAGSMKSSLAVYQGVLIHTHAAKMRGEISELSSERLLAPSRHQARAKIGCTPR